MNVQHETTFKLTITRKERTSSTFNNIYFLQVYNVKLRVKPAGHLHAATDSLSCGKTICGSLNDILCTRYRKCEEVVLLLSQIIFISSRSLKRPF